MLTSDQLDTMTKSIIMSENIAPNKYETFYIVYLYNEHEIGNENCQCDCCGDDGYPSGYPRRCECGGLIHASWYNDPVDIDSDMVMEECDKCGTDFIVDEVLSRSDEKTA